MTKETAQREAELTAKLKEQTEEREALASGEKILAMFKLREKSEHYIVYYHFPDRDEVKASWKTQVIEKARDAAIRELDEIIKKTKTELKRL